MQNQNFTTTILVDQTPEEVFSAINNIRGWWSEEIEGSTDKLNDEFKYHYKDVHKSHMKVIESIPNEKVVWLVMDNYFKFTKESNEWTGDKIIFEISEKDNKTHLRFTQLGLVPEYECFDICSNAWTHYIQQSLMSLITTGKGQPNATGKPSTENEKKEHEKKLQSLENQSFSTGISVDQTPEEAFNAIKNVRGWWLENIKGSTNKLNDEFKFYVEDDVLQFHFKIIEVVPNNKVVWLVVDQFFDFTKDKREWKDTKIIFEISQKDNKTQIRFTHLGLAPELECYDVCQNAWGNYINISLRSLITTGKGQPNIW